MMGLVGQTGRACQPHQSARHHIDMAEPKMRIVWRHAQTQEGGDLLEGRRFPKC